MNYPSDPEREFNAQTLRIFQFGHEIEDYAAKWLRDADFDLKTEDKSRKAVWVLNSRRSNKRSYRWRFSFWASCYGLSCIVGE